MSLPVFNPPMRPSPGTSHSPEVKLRTASFGDGYVQASPAGLNHIRDVVSFKWDFLSLAEAREIEGFFKARGGNQPFLYALNGETAPRQWTCETWNVTEGHPSRVTATFKENFVGRVTPSAGDTSLVVVYTQAEYDARTPGLKEIVILVDQDG